MALTRDREFEYCSLRSVDDHSLYHHLVILHHGGDGMFGHQSHALVEMGSICFIELSHVAYLTEHFTVFDV